MSSAISRERGKGKPYSQDALNVGASHHAGGTSLPMGAPQPSFATPTIPNLPTPQQEYDMTSPTMCLPVGTTIHPMGYGMSFLQHGGHYVARPGNAPPTHMRAQPPQQYYPPQQMFVQQQQFYPGPQYSRQPGMDYDPHAATMSTMYMGQQITHPTPMTMQPPPQQVQQQRNKNILTIQDPNTLEEVDLGARSDSATETKKDEPKGRKDVDETEQKKSEVMRQFTRQLQERNEMDQAESSGAGSLPSKPNTSREHTPVSTLNPEEQKAMSGEGVATTVETPPATEPILKDKTNETEPLTKDASQAESKPEPAVVIEEPHKIDEASIPAPSTPAQTTTSVSAPPLDPDPVKEEHEAHEERKTLPEIRTDSEAPNSTTPGGSAVVDDQEESLKSDIATAETVTESTVDHGSVADVEAEDSTTEVVDTPDAPTPDTEEEERRKAEEEEERKRQRLAELDTLLHSLLENPAEVDSDNLIYGRAFLYCVRDIEKEFKRCPCPLSHDKIVKLGIDLNSMPKGNDNKKQHSFIPPWMNQSRQSNKPSNRPYGGRFSHNDHRGGKGGNKKFPPSARPSIERNIERGVPLHKAENAWKPEKIRPEDLEKEEARIKLLLKNVRSLMNKITPTTKDDLIKEFLGYDVSSSPEQLASVINIIFDKAVEEPKFCPIYAEVCKQQVDKELKENSKLSLCRNALLNRAQETFVNKTWEEERNVKVKAIEEEEDPKKKLQMQLDLQEADNKFRRRKFGNITFIGQLYRQSLLSTKIVQWCLFDLIKHTHRNPETGKLPEPPFDEESLQCAIQLIESLGKQLDVSSPDFNGKEYLDQTLHHLECISSMTSNKIRFMIMNVVELRQSRWIPRKGADQGPKKLAEIHNEIKREQMENQLQRDQYDRKLRTGGSTSQHGRNPPPPRNSLDNRFGPKGGDRRSIAASKAKQTPSSVQPKSVSLLLKGDNSLGGSNRKTWHQGSGGGGNNSTVEAAKVGWQKPGRDEIPRKNSSVDERATTLATTKSGSVGKPDTTPVIACLLVTEPDSEELKAMREDLYKKIGKEVAAILETYDEGDMKLEECVNDIFKMVDAEQYGRPSVNEVFSRFTEYAVEKVRKPLLPKLGHMLCLALQNSEHRSEALAGMAKYCSLAVECEMWMDIPDIWSKLAELLVNAVYCDPNVITGVRPSFKDFTNVFIEASKDERKDKPYELLVVSLKRMAEMNAKVDSQDHATMSSFVYSEELPFLQEIDKERLENALRACRPDVPGFDDLYAVLHHH
ncbi:unnamed protein product [Haemonchus placei]|uniref:MIF4G domain-containing protein n=1 Tax=Haemonchus placei TaxID=6290 RepID=A0A158QMX3_HAEPC|nr:unnamed protein product [Haemonchus placei]